MDKRKRNRIIRMYESLMDERDELLENTEKLLENIKPHIDYVKYNINSQIDEEAILQYEKEVSQLLISLNLQVLKMKINVPDLQSQKVDHGCNKSTERSLIVLEEVSASSDKSLDLLNKSQEQQDYLKSNNNNKIDDCQLPNTADDIYSMKPLDNELLKIICANLANDSGQNSNYFHNNPENVNTGNVRTSSPTFSQLSETELSSTISSVSYQHPLFRMQVSSAEIPKQYVNQDIQTLKETFKKFSEKICVDESVLSTMQDNSQKTPGLNSCSKETSVKQEPNILKSEFLPEPSNDSDTTSFHTSSPHFSDVLTSPPRVESLPQDSAKHLLNKPDEGIEIISMDNDVSMKIIKSDNENEDVLLNHGLVCEIKDAGKHIQEENEPRYKDGTPIVNKVNVIPPVKTNPFLADDSPQAPTALDKLLSKQRVDRHQEAIQNALDSIPDLRLVPAEPLTVMRNNFATSENEKRGLSDSDKEREPESPNEKNKIANIIYDLKRTIPQEGQFCVFSYIESPTEFYLQIINEYSSDALDYVNNKMSQQLRGTNPEFASKEEAFSKLNKYCLGWVTEHKGWFRLQVLDWRLGSNSKEVDVKSVDYGFKASVSYAYLRVMINDVANIPMLAVKCYFPDLYPPGSVYNHRINKWPEESIEVMKDIAHFSGVYGEGEEVKCFRISVLMVDGDEAAVDLIDLDERDDSPSTFGEYLINLGAAVEIVDEYDDPELAEFLEDVDELENADNLNELILGYDARDEARICRFTRQDGTCYKGKNCKLEHTFLPKGGFTTDQMPIYRIPIDSLELPVNGEVLPVLVTDWIDSCTFLAQIIRNPVKDNRGVSVDRDLKDLAAALNHPKIVAELQPFRVAPAMGEIVVVYNNLYKKWMRGIVRTIERNEVGECISAEVYLADFGETLQVKIKELRQITENFVKLPFQCIKIYLHEFQHDTSCDNRKARRFFDKHIRNRNFLAEIRSSNAPWRVKLTTFKGHDIGVTLLKEKFAIKRKVDLHIQDGYKLELE